MWICFPTAQSPFLACLETQPFLCMTPSLLPFWLRLIVEWLIVLYKILHKELFYFHISMKAWVPTYKTSTKTSISHQNEKLFLPSAFLKCEDFSLELKMFIPLVEPTVVKSKQTHIHSIDRCLLFFSGGLWKFYFLLFFFLLLFSSFIFSSSSALFANFTRTKQDSQVVECPI